MAGIGFVLRKLARQDSLAGAAGAMLFSCLIVAGPWLITIFTLAVVSLLVDKQGGQSALGAFRPTIIYNFQFSLLLVSPFAVVATRYFADAVYERDASRLPGLLVGGLACVTALLLPCGVFLYYYWVSLPETRALLSVMNFLVVGILWFTSIFVSATRDYLFVCGSFLGGFALASILAIVGLQLFGADGVILGLTLGIAVVDAALLARLIDVFGSEVRQPFRFLSYFRRYWELAVGSVAFNLALWIDKWIMWFAPQAEWTENGFVFFPGYENAMFLASLGSLPMLAVFVLTVETGFYEATKAYQSAVVGHGSLGRIRQLQDQIGIQTLHSLRNLAVVGGVSTIAVLLLAPQVFNALGLSFVDIGIFRFGVLGNFFFQLIVFATVLLSYFDARRQACAIQILFLVLNCVGTVACLLLGEGYYGYGFFFATVISFACAATVFAGTIHDLPYLTFVLNNASLRLPIVRKRLRTLPADAA